MDDQEEDLEEIATYKEHASSKSYCFVKRQELHHQKWLIYPEGIFKRYWDIFIAMVLIFSCFVTPYRVALIQEDTSAWSFTNTVVDLLFLLDILIIFNSAYFDDDFKLIQNRKTICAQYLKGWFIVDAIAIFPFQIMMSGAGNYSDMVRITRIGRMYKLLKLTKLFRTLKMMKEKDKVLGYMQRYMSIGVGMQRLIVFTIVFLIMCM